MEYKSEDNRVLNNALGNRESVAVLSQNMFHQNSSVGIKQQLLDNLELV
jgi:hypothetical protein